jgi:hypothetical protein
MISQSEVEILKIPRSVPSEGFRVYNFIPISRHIFDASRFLLAQTKSLKSVKRRPRVLELSSPRRNVFLPQLADCFSPAA